MMADASGLKQMDEETQQVFTSEATDSTTPREVPEREDMILKAIDIANVARNVREMAENAYRKASYIASLHERAVSEADELSRVACSVAATASSVALMALQVCQYSSFEDAFNANPHYSQRIGIDNFLDLVDREYPVVPSIPSFPRNTAGRSAHGQLTEDLYGSRLPSRKSAFQTRRHSTSDSPGARHSHTNSNVGSMNSNSSELKFQERYPDSVTQLKDTLASSIETCISTTTAKDPLYEDVYCCPNRRVPQAPSNSTDSWLERKKCRQFQIKLKQVDPENTSACSIDSARASAGSLVRVAFPMGATVPDVTPSKPAAHTKPVNRQKVTKLKKHAYSHEEPKVPKGCLSVKSYDAEGDTTDSEVESYMSESKQVATVKALESTDSDGQRLAPKARGNPRAISPLLNRDEMENCKVVGRDKSPVPKYRFRHSNNNSDNDEESRTIQNT